MAASSFFLPISRSPQERFFWDRYNLWLPHTLLLEIRGRLLLR
jgi:hypothetical protein